MQQQRWMSVMLPLPTLVAVSIYFVSNCQLGACQRQLLNVGPSDIKRFEGERNVYIPCPFPGSLNPIWRINNVEYEAFNLPQNMMPVSFGLLITTVDLGMDGRSFQCILPTQQQDVFWMSVVGTLSVEKMPPESADNLTLINKPNNVVTTISNTLKLDHQRIYFEASEKIFSWRDMSASRCTYYKVTSVTCGDQSVRTWDRYAIQGTSITIDSEDTVDNHNHTLYFKLQSVTADTGGECYTFPIYFSVQESTITEYVPTSYDGVCRDVYLSNGIYIVLPNKTGGDDCLCSILFTDGAYNLTNCSCGSDTIFTNSLYVTELTTAGNGPYFKICFINLTAEMNNTIVHLYKSLRLCYDEYNSPIIKPIRMYIKSWKLVLELPHEPIVQVDTFTGEVSLFSLQPPGGIKVDHYQLTLSDVTNLTLIHRSLPGDTTSVSLGSVFHDNICSPYNLTIRAYGVSRNFISKTIMINSTTKPNGSDPCTCIKSRANVELRLTVDDQTEKSIQVNCTQNYEDDVYVKLVAEQNDKPASGSQTYIMCRPEKQLLKMDSLKCNQPYDLKAYWIHNSSNNECPLLSMSQDSVVPCPEDNEVIIITGSTLGSSTLILFLATILVPVCVYKLKNRKNNYVLPSSTNN